MIYYLLRRRYLILELQANQVRTCDWPIQPTPSFPLNEKWPFPFPPPSLKHSLMKFPFTPHSLLCFPFGRLHNALTYSRLLVDMDWHDLKDWKDNLFGEFIFTFVDDQANYFTCPKTISEWCLIDFRMPSRTMSTVYIPHWNLALVQAVKD